MLAIGLSLVALVSIARAQTSYYYDVNGATSGSGVTANATYSWTTATGNWSTSAGGTAAAANWVNGNSVAIFSAGTDAANDPYTLNLGANLNFRSITVEEGLVTVALGATNTLSVSNGTSTFNVAGNQSLTLTGSRATPQLVLGTRSLVVTGAGDTTLAVGLSGSNTNALLKSGTGTLALSGNNPFTGSVVVSSGTLEVGANAPSGAAGALGNASSAVLLGNTTTGVNNSSLLLAQSGITIGRAITATNNGTGVMTIGGGITTGTGNFSGTVTLNRAATFTAAGDSTITFNGTVAGTGALTKTGTGEVALTGSTANTQTGNVTVADGTLSLGKTAGTNALGTTNLTVGDGTGAAGSAILRFDADNQLANTTAVTLAADGLFNVNGRTETIASIAGAGEIQIGAGQLVSAGDTSTEFSGQLTGNGTFTKQGLGTLTLSAATINYGGTFELNGGTLLLSSTTASFDTLSVTGNTTLDFGGTASSLSLSTLTIANGVTLTIANWTEGVDALYALTWTNGTYDTRGTTPMTQIVFGGFTANDTRWLSIDNQITPVPEPSTYGALLFATLLGGFGWRRWRARLTQKL